MTNPFTPRTDVPLYDANHDSQHRAALRVDANLPTIVLSVSEYERFHSFVLDRTGLDFTQDKAAQLARGLARVMAGSGIKTLDDLYFALKGASATSALWDELVSALTIGETYFFRNTSHFDALTKNILPEIMRAREGNARRLRIWSAGCATGEEAYSLAMLLREIIPQPESWNILILATDINRESLAAAQRATYGAWSFRGVDTMIQEKYFHQVGDKRFVLDGSVKRMVTFDYLNLVTDTFPSLFNNTNAMDIILCRNVTIYFSEQITRGVLQKFHQSLVEGGWFIPGPSEPNLLFYDAFDACTFPGAVVYRKNGDKRAAAPVAPPPAKAQVRVTPLPVVQAPPKPKPVVLPPKPVVTPEPVAASQDPYAEALALFEQGRAQDALPLLYRKLDKDPKYSPAYALIGKIHADQGRLEDARQWCERAIAIDRLHPEPYYTLALIYQENGNPDMAIDALKNALYLNRDFIMGHYNLGMLYLQQGNRDLAARSFQNVQRLIQNQARDQLIPEGDGLNVGRLNELVVMHLAQEA